jgi:hypothetical protein
VDSATARIAALGVGLAVAIVCGLCGQCALPPEGLALLGRDPAAPASTTILASLLRTWVEAAGRVGAGVHDAAIWFSAGAAGAGAAAVFAAATRLQHPPRAAAAAALLAATCPAVAFAATRVHVHAAEFALAAVALLATVAWARRPTWWRAVVAGAISGALHASAPVGVLLPIVTLAWFGLHMERPASVRRVAWQVFLHLASHAAVALAALRGAALAGLPGAAEVAAYDLGTLLPLLHSEWLRSCLVLAAIAGLALLHRAEHIAAVLLHAALGLYLVLACHTTATLGDDGACLLPLVPSAALLAMRVLAASPRLLLAALAVSALQAATKIVLRADWSSSDAFATGLDAAIGDTRCAVVIGPRADEAAVLARPPRAEIVRMQPIAAGPPPAVAAFAAALRQRLADGQRVFLTEEVEAALMNAEFRASHPSSPLLLQALRDTFVWRPIWNDRFSAKELLRR